MEKNQLTISSLGSKWSFFYKTTKEISKTHKKGRAIYLRDMNNLSQKKGDN